MIRCTMNKPKVSVSLITYNQENCVRATIESILQQDYENVEIVISDDASTDQTPNIIAEYYELYPSKIIFLKNLQRGGVTINSQRALEKCSGDFVTFIGGDDLYLPGKLSAQVKWFFEHSDAVACYHDIILFDRDKKKIIDRYYSTICGMANKVLFYRCFAAAQSIMLKRSAIPLNGYNKTIPNCSDWFLVVDALIKSRGYIGYVDGVYAYYVKHQDNITKKNKKLYLEIVSAYKQYKLNYPKYLKQFDLCLAEEAIAGIKNSLKNKDLKSMWYCLYELLHTSSIFKALFNIIARTNKKIKKNIF